MRPRAVPYYPVALDLHGRKAVVVGDGELARAKVLALLEAGAQVDLVTLHPTVEMSALASASRISLRNRAYQEGDLHGAFLAIAAVPDPEIRARIRKEAVASGVLLNSVDDIPNCDFIAPAILRRGQVTIAISTGGASPALAVRLRQAVARVVRSEHGQLASILGELRGDVARRVPSAERRKQLWLEVVDSPALSHLRRGRRRDACATIERIVGQYDLQSNVQSAPARQGTVTLVGAGPGNPGLITVAGLRALRAADAVVYDRLVHHKLLSAAPDNAQLIYAGKRPEGRSASQDWINETLISLAREGFNVVRLKGGDPFVFGRGAEECDALRSARIRFQVIPGVSSATAAPAAAEISLTDRQNSSAFVVVTAQQSPGARPIDWGAVARIPSIVVLMGLGKLELVLRRLMDHGIHSDTPAAMISSATLAKQRVVRANVSELAAAVTATAIQAPATLIIGEIARSRTNECETVQYPGAYLGRTR